MKTTQLIIATLTMIIGGLIYILFRTQTLIMFDWFKILLLEEHIENMRLTSMTFSKNLPDWFLFSFPDGLWLFSYITLILVVWKNQINKHSIAWILVVPFYVIILEIGQLLDYWKGTFDFNDLLFYSMGIISPFIIYNNLLTIKFKNYEQKN